LFQEFPTIACFHFMPVSLTPAGES
jgi:hypothetical protein